MAYSLSPANTLRANGATNAHPVNAALGTTKSRSRLLCGGGCTN